MVFRNENDELKMVINTCNCGCGSELHIKKYVDDISTDYYISLHSSKFDEEQLGIFGVLKRRLKRAWFSLRGKDYLYMDIGMNANEYKNLIKEMNKLI